MLSTETGSSAQSTQMDEKGPKLWVAMLLTAMAGGLGWGIRGQYGHETGAMVPGVLVALTLALLFCPTLRSLYVARAVALMTVGISFGGSMTYGQTVGLTHDGPLIGDSGALTWGMLGLFLKGGIWIGFAGLFLGMSLSAKTYRPVEWGLLLGVTVLLVMIGREWLNEPFHPEKRELPWLYFSDHWRWEPESVLKPRREGWGGLLLALLGLMLYAGWCRKDVLARRMALWGMLGGGMGFTLGQAVQAFHAWNATSVNATLGWLAQHMNWWNMMETSFGMIFGAILALGLWRNRGLIAGDQDCPVEISGEAEWFLVFIHALVLASGMFGWIAALERWEGMTLTMGLLPVVAISAGRWWPYVLPFFLVCLPIATKTMIAMIDRSWPWIWLPIMVYFVLPLALTLVLTLWQSRRATSWTGGQFARVTLFSVVWLYMGLNWAFFDFPWPWVLPWTGRTPNAVIFTVCAVGLTLACLFVGRSKTTVAG